MVAQYEQSIAADFLATSQADKQRREELYASLWGARGLLEFMKLNAQAAAAIKDHKPPTNEDSTTGYAISIDEEYDDEGFLRAENDY